MKYIEYILGCIVSIGVLLLTPSCVYAATYYVSPSGSDSNNGSIGSPWKTIQKATSTLVAGDTVLIREGKYNETVTPKQSGTATSPIVYKAYPGEKPEIISTTYGISIEGTSGSPKAYIEMNGLTITGQDPSGGTGTYCSAGIASYYTHHIRIINNTIRGFGQGGIDVGTGADYQDIEGNTIYDNCMGCNDYRGSGVSLWSLVQSTSTSTEYHYIVSNNLIYHQYHDSRITNHSDGNGVIVDQANNNPPVLIENNVIFDNAGLCINVYQSSNTTAMNNTCYQNGADTATDEVEIGIVSSTNVKAYNNIFVSRNSNQTTMNYQSTGLTFDYNLHFGGTPEIKGAHDILGNPNFISPSTDPLTANFYLQSNSPAIDKGTSLNAPTVDYDGNSRPNGAGYDIGAYEYGGTPPPTGIPTATPITSPTPTPSPKAGDLNGDGKVDIYDYNIMLADFGKTGSPGWIPADIIKDGKVDIYDYNVLVGNFGK
jgi:parallel beta-helix repeat protein